MKKQLLLAVGALACAATACDLKAPAGSNGTGTEASTGEGTSAEQTSTDQTTTGGVDPIPPFVCGDDSFSFCGGDPTGEWLFTRECIDAGASEAELQKDCTGARFKREVAPSGSISFGADKSYDLKMLYTTITTYTLPVSCRGSSTECPAPLGGWGSLKSSDGDDCVYELKDQVYSQKGSYYVVGSKLHTKPSDKNGAEDTPFDFCVQGDALKFLMGSGDRELWNFDRKPAP